MDDIQSLLTIIFILGGGGAITVLVTSWRRLKSGKLGDEESVIKRLHRELTRHEARADLAEHELEETYKDRQRWREQAWQYRIQLMAGGLTPRDDRQLWPVEDGDKR